MRIRSAKKLAQRIDLTYFKHAHPLRRWRTILSIVAPVVGLLWIGGMSAAGSRAPYSSGPVSAAHAFAEAKCDVCHVRDTAFRAHVGEKACLTCHDGPPHAANETPPPGCATCHREHQGRVALAATADRFCVRCHGSLSTTHGEPKVAKTVTAFPAGHPELRAAAGAVARPVTIRFSHQTHLAGELRGPAGPETLECAGCHTPEIARASSERNTVTPLTASIDYERHCARCHTLFFDERIDAQVPHEKPATVRAFVQRSLQDYISAHPGDMSKADPASRRVPLNFPRPPEPPSSTPADWIARRTARAERRLWTRTCAACHEVGAVASTDRLPEIAPAQLRAQRMPDAKFDHAPHLLIECASCHQSQNGGVMSDVLMPGTATCAACHAPGRGAGASCVECHGYHDWTKAHAVKARFKVSDFQ